MPPHPHLSLLLPSFSLCPSGSWFLFVLLLHVGGQGRGGFRGRVSERDPPGMGLAMVITSSHPVST